MKLKAIIVTVHNSENCGSFLQAFAMQRTLQLLGYDVSFLYRNPSNTSHAIKKCFRSVRYLLHQQRYTDAWYVLKRWIIYEYLQKKYFRQVTPDSSFAKKADLVVLGSDTIWNFEDKYFYSTADRLLGLTLKGKHIISYAASLGNTSENVFKNVVDEHGGLDHISKLLVRDSYTQKALKSSFGRESEIVCDPTLLVTSDCFNELTKAVNLGNNYILLYYFGEVPLHIKEEVLRYARSHNLKVASLIYKRDWCDIFIPSSPINMVSYYKESSSVVTNTFHGCALSLIFQKPFAVYEEGKIKVTELLGTYYLSDRLFSDSSVIPMLLERKINNMEIIRTTAEKSMKRLKDVIK